MDHRWIEFRIDYGNEVPIPLRNALERHEESLFGWRLSAHSGTSWRNANGKGSGSQRNRNVYDGAPPSVPLGNFLMFRGIFRQLW
jgi:hypothetical protein